MPLRSLRQMAMLYGALLALPAYADASTADSWPQVWLNPGFYSRHFDSGKNLRNDNIGLGAEVMLARDHGLMAGNFINSNRTRSRLAAYQWRPLHWNMAGFEVGAGIAVSALDGYPNYRNGAWFITPLPLLTIEGEILGMNFSIVPTVANRINGALVAQIKLRVR